MFTEFFLKNAFNLAILFSCGMALLVVRFWLSRNVQWKKGFTFHAAQFFYLCNYYWDHREHPE